MEPKISYAEFINSLDKKLERYFQEQASNVCCQKGCSSCCEKGDYPISELELKYIMQGYIKLDNKTKQAIQDNIKFIEKGGKCPFLLNSECSIYKFRPIICRVHGLAYLCKDNTAKLPYCTNYGKNYSKHFLNNELLCEPIRENLDTQNLLKDFNYGEIRNLYDWLNPNETIS